MAFAMAGTGVISLVYWFEIYYEAGFTAYWWSSLTEPALIVIALSGWIVYRFRQTRAMTLAQFFEMRYSRNFRVFAGLVAFLSRGSSTSGSTPRSARASSSRCAGCRRASSWRAEPAPRSSR